MENKLIEKILEQVDVRYPTGEDILKIRNIIDEYYEGDEGKDTEAKKNITTYKTNTSAWKWENKLIDVIPIRDLKKGDKVKCEVNRNGVESEEILLYDGMDGMYAKLITDDGSMLNATGYLKYEGDFYVFVKHD